MESASTLVDALQKCEAYPHDVQKITVRETHISWVILTGNLAYKIKKPVELGFLDFTTLDRRRYFCHQEVQLNRRYAPELYLDVVPITGSPTAPRIEGSGVAIEYAVRMRQFQEEKLFSRMIADGTLQPTHVEELAQVVGRFHASADRAVPASALGSPAEIEREALENVQELNHPASDQQEIVEELGQWTRSAFHRLRATFQNRRDAGFVRECHGDLHLGNLVIVNNQVTMFDGIEFNDEFRWIDVMSDAAFVVMDLNDRGRPDLSHRFLNAYLEITGDYEGIQVLVWYLVHRSLVRAKVAKIRASQADITSDERHHRQQQTDDYLRLARYYTRGRWPAIILTHGVSGSGKTTGTTRLLEEIGIIRIRSDVERKRLAGLESNDSSGSALDAGQYTPEASRKTYDHMAILAKHVVQAGFPVVVDATFLSSLKRDVFHQLAATLRVPFFIVPFSADIDVLRARIRDRHSTGKDASEATVAVLQRQLETQEPLSDEELKQCRTVKDLIPLWKRGRPHE